MISFTTRNSLLVLSTVALAFAGGNAAAQDVTRRPLDPGSVPQIQFDPQQVPPKQRSGGGNADAKKPVQPAAPAEAQPRRNENPVAEFSGIDKITGRIISFDVYVNETVQFGALQVTPRVCYSSPQEDEPRTDSFVEVDEITLDRKIRRIFTGWMFAESPGLNAVEHAVYDVWLKSCKKSSEVPPPQAVKAGG